MTIKSHQVRDNSFHRTYNGIAGGSTFGDEILLWYKKLKSRVQKMEERQYVFVWVQSHVFSELRKNMT